jgi:hypothetical protein
VGPTPIYMPPSQTSNPSIQEPRSSVFHTVHGTMILILPSTHCIIHSIFSSDNPGSHLLAPVTGTHTHYHYYQIIVICSLSSDIFHIGYLVFVCAGSCYEDIQPIQSWPSYGPFRYMFNTGMQSIPLQTIASPSHTL